HCKAYAVVLPTRPPPPMMLTFMGGSHFSGSQTLFGNPLPPKLRFGREAKRSFADRRSQTGVWERGGYFAPASEAMTWSVIVLTSVSRSGVAWPFVLGLVSGTSAFDCGTNSL